MNWNFEGIPFGVQMVIGYKKHLDEANRLPTKKDVSYAIDSSSGYSHLSSFIGVIDVKGHYNFVVAASINHNLWLHRFEIGVILNDICPLPNNTGRWKYLLEASTKYSRLKKIQNFFSIKPFKSKGESSIKILQF